MHPLVQQAIKALKIDSPIYRAEVKGNKVTLWLCAHNEPVIWRKPAKKEPKK